MKGARLIVPGCTGFSRAHPGIEYRVLDLQHYKVMCVPVDAPADSLDITYIPLRDFILLNYPRDEKLSKET